MKKWSKVFLVFMSVIIFFVAFNDLVFADEIKLKEASEEEIMKIHEDLDGIMVIDKGLFYGDMLRTLGYWTVGFFDMVLRSLEKGVDSIITFGNFYETWAISDLMDRFQPFVMGLFLLTLIVVGIMLMLNKIEKRQDLLMNILLAVTMIVVIPNLFPLLNKVMVDGIDLVDGRGSLANDVLATNVADLEMYVYNDFKYGGEGGLPQPIHPNNPNLGTADMSNANEMGAWYFFEPTEKIDLFEGEGFWKNKDWYNEIENDHPISLEVLSHRSDPKGKGEEMELRTLRKNLIVGTQVGRESYYRYSVNWGTILVTQIILSFALMITVIKMGRIVFDLGFHMIFSMFIAATDLTGGQRTKKMITEIVSSFAVFFVMVLILKLFIVYANWLVGLQAGGSLGTFTYLLMLIAGTWALLDAPDIVQRLLGIDAGLRSGYQALMGAWAMSKGLGAIPKLAGKGANMASSAVGAGAGAGAFTKGLMGRPPKSGGGAIPPSGGSGGGGNPPPPNGGGGGGGGNPPDDPPPPNDGGGGGIPPTPTNNGDGGSIPPTPTNNGDGGSIPPTPTNNGGSGSVPPMPTNNGGSGSIPPIPTNNSGSGSIPPTPTNNGDGGSIPPTPTNNGGSGSIPPMPTNNGDGGSIPPTPTNNGGGGSIPPMPSNQGQGFINPDPKQIDSNPYYKPTFFGGGARGQKRAITQAKAYNSGTNLRRNLGKVSSGIKSSSTGRKAVGRLGGANRIEKDIRDFNID